MMEALSRLHRRIQHLIGAVRVSLVGDSGPVQVLQVQALGPRVQDDVPRMGEYGLASRPPPGTDAVALYIGGAGTDAVVIATNHGGHRPRDLADGEVMLHDSRGQRVYLSAAGIRIVGGSLPIQIDTDATLTIRAGALVVDCDATFNRTVTVAEGVTFNDGVTATGVVSANGKRIDESHVHPAGFPNTGPVA